MARRRIWTCPAHPNLSLIHISGGGSLSPCGYWLYCTAVQSDDGFKAGHWRRAVSYTHLYKQRMEKGLSFLEFNYMIMQSYDFYYMFQHCLLYTSRCV